MKFYKISTNCYISCYDFNNNTWDELVVLPEKYSRSEIFTYLSNLNLKRRIETFNYRTTLIRSLTEILFYII